jgi:hypothetical protein
MSTNAAAANSADIPAPVATSLARPLRNLALTLTLTILALAAAQYFWGPAGYERLIPALGLPHVFLGFVFYFGRVLRGEPQTRSLFLVLALATALFWIAHYTIGIVGLISIYFVYHVLRDEVFVYQQTRARHRLNRGSMYIAGVVPLILLVLLIPRPQHYRQDLRRVELTGSQFAANGWTLVTFQPVSYSRGREFYFYLQAPKSESLAGFTAQATVLDSRADGEIRIGDKNWKDASDLVFKPHYAGLDDQPAGGTGSVSLAGPEIAVGLTGGHKVGQRFTADADNLAGIWLNTQRENDAGANFQFVFHLASPALLPLSGWMEWLRVALIVGIGIVAFWQIVPQLRNEKEFWLYFTVLLGVFIVFQQLLKKEIGFEHLLPMMFQVVVVFHYLSWYVFSFDKLGALAESRPPVRPAGNFYDRILGTLGQARNFAILIVVLNVLSICGSIWYYQGHGPGVLRYGFDYSYFLYILVFHVTFSISPKRRKQPAVGRPDSISLAKA